MSEIRANKISDISGIGPIALTKQYTAKMWVQASLAGTATIFDSVNVSSITDLGTGTPQFNLTNALDSRNGTVSVCCGLYSTNIEVAVQIGGYIVSTTQIKNQWGSNTTALNDWIEGYSSCLGDLA